MVNVAYASLKNRGRKLSQLSPRMGFWISTGVLGYPPTRYIDNVGVQPDIFADLMTKENLLNQGKSFSQSMVDAITAYVRQQGGK